MTEYNPDAEGVLMYNALVGEVRQCFLEHCEKGRDCTFNGGTCTDEACFNECKILKDCVEEPIKHG